MGSTSFTLPIASTKSEYFANLGQDGILRWCVLNIGTHAEFRLTVEKVTPLRAQGIWLHSGGVIEVKGKVEAASSQKALMFYDAPHEVTFSCETSDGLLRLYNLWEVNGQPRSLMRMSGMDVENIPGGYRYRCTDTGPDPDFERFIFTLVRIDGPLVSLA
jgi:hypothetical protein